MIACANFLAEKEDELCSPDPYFDLIMNKHLAKNEYPEDLFTSYRASGKCSLMAKAVTRELWDKYCNV